MNKKEEQEKLDKALKTYLETITHNNEKFHTRMEKIAMRIKC